jgi:transcriptional regulator with GAF, ATPase, and Fis domain
MEDRPVSELVPEPWTIDQHRSKSPQKHFQLPAIDPFTVDVSCEETTRSPAIERIHRDVKAVAPLRSTVLITGETGTGKGVMARLVHHLSNRKDRPFVHVDCAALNASLIESELFGHDRGAFTGAMGRRVGRFEAAGNGTIFLDEVGELSQRLQSKLLRVLQDRSFERIGENQTLRMNARVIAATNRDLELEVREGRFRKDLLYRLDVFRLEMPSLRDRIEDIESLIESGVKAIADDLDLSPPLLTNPIIERLQRHDWPGNLRELMNVLERLVIRHSAGLLGEFTPDHLFPHQGQNASPARGPVMSPRSNASSTSERAILEAELTASGGNVSRVARRLGVARSTLRNRIKHHNLRHLIPSD